MNKRKNLRWMIALLLLLALTALLSGWFAPRAAQPVQAGIIGLPTPTVDSRPNGGYAVAAPGALSLPRDFGPRPDFLTEWWYYTGNLQTADGRHFGFQLTFFRRAVSPPADVTPRPSDWAAGQIYLAHFTLTDVAAQKFHYFERYERGAAGLAGATLDPSFQVWLHDWSVQQAGDQNGAPVYRLHAAEQGVALDLTLVDRMGPVLEGDRGYSQKGPQAGNASLYFSQPRLASNGTVSVAGQQYAVSGLTWMDREISTSALAKGEVGWDWFALQLDDGSALMTYVLRRSDGSVSAFSNGTFIAADGQTRRLAQADFQIQAQSTWRSPHSGGVYPSAWQVRVPALALDLTVTPLLADQELNVSFTYWEGAVKFNGTRAGKAVNGSGYVELTGYAKSMEGSL